MREFDNVAELYDLVYSDRHADVDYYVEQVVKRNPERVLEVGCATGRVTIKLARALPTAHIVAIDVDLDAVNILRDKLASEGLTNVTVEHIDIADFVTEPVDVLLAPFRVFQHVDDPVALQICLNSCAESLRDGGTMLVDFYNPSIPWLAQTGVVDAGEFVSPGGSTIQRVVTVNECDYFRQFRFIEEDYTITDPDGTKYNLAWHYPTRYYFLGELTPMFKHAGFTVASVASDWYGSPFGKTEYPGDLVITAVKELGGSSESPRSSHPYGRKERG